MTLTILVTTVGQFYKHFDYERQDTTDTVDTTSELYYFFSNRKNPTTRYL